MDKEQYHKICDAAHKKFFDFLIRNGEKPTKILMTGETIDKVAEYIAGHKLKCGKVTFFLGMQVLRSDDISNDEIYVF